MKSVKKKQKFMTLVKFIYGIMIFENGKYQQTLPVVFDTTEQRDLFVELYSLKERSSLANQQLVFTTFERYAKI